MAWWNSVASLTPIVAHDALGYAGATSLPDRVGSNAVNIVDAVGYDEWRYKAVKGNAKMWAYGSSVASPATGVWAILWNWAGHEVVAFSGGSGEYVIDINTAQLYSSPAAGQFASYGALTVGEWMFCAVVKGATTAQAIVNGVVLPTTLAASKVPASVSRLLGYSTDGAGYALTSTEKFGAAGIWSGTPTLADIQALEAAMRTDMLGVTTPSPRTLAPGRTFMNGASPNALANATPLRFARPMNLGKRPTTIVRGGRGQIIGTTKTKADPTDIPVSRKVRLHDEASGQLIAETWSTAGTGAYAFQYIDESRTYTVLSYDHTGVFRAVIADGQIPEIM